MYKLIIEDDEGKTRVVPWLTSRDEITIGRKEGNTIRLTERNVSRKHAKLQRQNGTIFIEDLQSYNGIKVNGDRIGGKTSVSEGDRIQIGDYQLALKLDRAAAAIPEMRADEKTTPFLRDDPPATVRAHTIDLPPTVQQPVLGADAERPARLVVVSSNFARQEFPLDKATTVIGRTDDNDVVVNHRSISRHHAQIQREGNHFHVIDLQSANGVRVNGEEYGKVEFRKGDMIDLGHVRMRFVAPGEDFVFERDAKVVDVAAVAPAARSRAGFYAALGAGALALLAVGVLLAKLASSPKPDSRQGLEGDIPALAFAADKAMKTRDWDTAIAKCDEGLAIDPKQDTLKDKKAKAVSEKKNFATYEKYEKERGANAIDAAVSLFQQIPDESVYHDMALESFAPLKKAYIREHLERAKRLPASKCDEVRVHTDSVLMLDQSNTEAMDIAKRCAGPTAAPPTPRPVRAPPSPSAPSRNPGRPSGSGTPRAPQAQSPTPVVAPPPRPEQPKPEPPSAQAEIDKLLIEAQESYVHGNYADAVEKARKANKLQNSNKAWQIIGSSYCFMKDRAGAIAAWNRLNGDNKSRQFLQYVCNVRNGIDLQAQ